MFVELLDLFNNEGLEIKIEHTIDLTQYDYYASKPFTSPVNIIGFIKNTAGVVELNAEIKFSAEFNCDRCAESFKREFSVPMVHTLVCELNNEDNDELLLLENMKLDIDELALSDILLAMPTKLLCSESCKGVCSGCGKNLNKEDCICKKEVDPRLASLLSLIQE